MLDVYVRGFPLPDQPVVAIGAFGIKDGIHTVLRYADILDETFPDKLVDLYAVFKILELLKQHFRLEEPIVVQCTDKLTVNCINGKRKPANQEMEELINRVSATLREMKNVEVKWVKFEDNLANLLINQIVLKNEFEYYVRKEPDSLDKEQLIRWIAALEKENLKLQQTVQHYGVELGRLQIFAKALQEQLKTNQQELDNYKALIDQYTTEQKIAYLLALPPLSPYLH